MTQIVPDSAQATVRNMLAQYGLGNLGDWAWQRYQDGASIDQILTELYDRPEFAVRFPAYADLAKKGRAPSLPEMIAYEKAAVGLMHQYGIPAGFYDTPDDIANLMKGEVSIAELSQRLNLYEQAVYEEPPETRAQLRALYNLDEGSLLAYAIDPERALPIITRQYRAAGVAGAATRAGYGQLTASEAEQIGGVATGTQAQQGFTQLAGMGELFAPLPGTSETTIGREAQLGATFEGNAANQAEIERRAASRRAQYQQGGAPSTSQRGIIGAGAAT